ncbi:MAG: magnesium/cobalt transporter CorA [Acidobacteria bacterium]|nr:MAG: magnesium/cobalt transporter CorA [Acidobacteriota bacterium]
MTELAAATGSVIASAAYADGRRIGDVALDDISDVIGRPDTFVWIGLYEPNEPLLRKIQEEFRLHDLAIEDALSAHQRPKVERYDNSIFVVLRTAQIEDPKPGKPCDVRYGEVHMFVGRNFIITVRHGYATSFTSVRTRAEATPELLKQGPAFVLYVVMDFIVDQYFPIVDALEEELEALEHRVFTQPFSRRTTTQIYKLKRDLISLRRVVSPVIELSARLIRFEDEDMIPAQTRPYFRDVYDHTLRISDMIDSVRDLLGTALEAHLSLVSVSQNEDTRRLAAWAAIFAVPTAIAGIYGMNFNYMPELRWRFGYPLVLAGIIGICWLLYVRFKQAKWL